MRNRLIAGGMLMSAAFAAGCLAQDAPNEGDAAVTIEITLDVATEVEVARIDRASPLYDLDQSRLNLVFTNRGRTPLAFPGEAIMRRVLRVYTDKARGAQQMFNMNEPPVGTADLTQLAPGESWRYGVGLELPEQLLLRDVRATTVQVCVTWDKVELDTSLFPAGSYDWAESFSACQDVVMRR
jgi:hypothetical protein